MNHESSPMPEGHVEVRADQIPHSKTFFTDHPRDVQSQIEDRKEERKSSIEKFFGPGLAGVVLGPDDGEDPGFVIEGRRDGESKKGKQL